jgi:hypothetical protein
MAFVVPYSELCFNIEAISVLFNKTQMKIGFKSKLRILLGCPKSEHKEVLEPGIAKVEKEYDFLTVIEHLRGLHGPTQEESISKLVNELEDLVERPVKSTMES